MAEPKKTPQSAIDAHGAVQVTHLDSRGGLPYRATSVRLLHTFTSSRLLAINLLGLRTDMLITSMTTLPDLWRAVATILAYPTDAAR